MICVAMIWLFMGFKFDILDIIAIFTFLEVLIWKNVEYFGKTSGFFLLIRLDWGNTALKDTVLVWSIGP